jgi:hypothetical protein
MKGSMNFLRIMFVLILFWASALVSAGTIELPQTGQTTCYDASGTIISCSGTGQDGDINAGTPWPNPRLTYNSDQTVTDNLAGLIWVKDGKLIRDPGFDNDGTAGDGRVTWEHALDYIKRLNQENHLGHNDWRLPNVIELESLINEKETRPLYWLNAQDFSIALDQYWSSSTTSSNPSAAWTVSMIDGNISSFSKSYFFSVLPVRSEQTGALDSSSNFLPKTGQKLCYNASGTIIDCNGTGQDGELQMGAAWPTTRFVDNGNQTISDNLTGLTWTKNGDTPGPATCGPGGTMIWQSLLDYVKCLNTNNYLGYNDWHLPNKKEFWSLVNIGEPNQADWLKSQGYTNLGYWWGFYWSSTTEPYKRTQAYIITLSDGRIEHSYQKSLTPSYLWPVRTGPPKSLGNFIISKSGDGSGTISSYPTGITCGANCSAYFTKGTTVTLTANPDSGSTFTGWSGGGCQGTGSCTVNMNSNMSVTASFVQKNSNSLKASIFNSQSGAPIQAVTVNLDGQELPTDEGGSVTFTGISLGLHDIAIQKTGFEPVATRVNVGSAGINKMSWSFVPVKTAEKPVVTDVTSYYTNRDKKAYFLDGVDFPISFTANVNWNGNPSGYIRFITPRNIHDEASGSHTFNMGSDFGPGGCLQVIAMSAGAVSSDPVDASIEVMPLPPGIGGIRLDDQDTSFSYSFDVATDGENLTVILPQNGVTVSADIPIFGGKEMSLGIKAETSVKVGSDGMATYSFTGSHDNQNPFKVAGYDFDTGWSIGGNVSFKYRKDPSQWHFDSGHFKAGLSASKDIPPYYLFVTPIPIPFYLRATIEGKLDASIGFTGWAEGAGWQLDGTVEPGVGGKAIAGAGIADTLCLEGYLGIDGSLLFDFPSAPIFREAALALSGGVSAKAFWFTYDEPLWKYKWSWPENSTQSLSRSMLSEGVMKDIRTVAWQPIPRNYGSGLATGRKALEAGRVPLEAIPGEQIIPGQTDIYPYSYPSLINMGSDLLLAWVADDLTKTTNNRTSIEYSRYTGGQWSNASKIGEDGTADYYPSLAGITGGAVAAWQDTGTVFGDQATMEEVLAQQEIAVSLFNATTNVWSTPARLTANSYLDRSPLVAASGDKAVAVWIANEQNDMFGSQEKPNAIKYAAFNGTEWSQAATATAGVGAILKSALTYRGATATYVFAVDVDGDLSTLTDHELYVIAYDGSTWSAATRLTEDAVQDTNPQLAYSANGDQLLVWYKGGNFQMAKNLDMANSATVLTPGLSSGAADFRLVSGHNGQLFIVWPDASSRGQDLYLAPYEPTLNVWGKGMKMTDTDSMERTLAAVQTQEGQVAVVYNRVATVMTPRDVEVGGKTVTLNVPGPGATDLCMSAFALEEDPAVRAKGLTVSPSVITPGASLTFNAVVVNNGLKPAQDIAVDFYYGDPAADGVQIGQRQTIAGPLASGEEAMVSVAWTAPQTPEAKDIYIVVDPALSIEDRDRTNNATHIAVFQPDLAITQAFSQTVGPVKRGLTVSVTNTGLVPAANIPVMIKKDGTAGNLIYEELIDELAPGEKRDVVYEWNPSGLVSTDGYLKIYVEANGARSIAESSYLNNTRTIQVLGALPGEAGNPGFQSGATDVSIRPQFTWQAATGATSYDLYLWKEGETKPTIASLKDIAGVTVTASNPLSLLTGYRWQIVAKNASGQKESAEWTFTTGTILVGDLNDDKEVNLLDTILALQAIGGLNPTGIRADYAASDVDVNGDGKIGLAEGIYILQKAAGMR